MSNLKNVRAELEKMKKEMAAKEAELKREEARPVIEIVNDIQGDTYVINAWVDSLTEEFLLKNIDSLENIDSSNESSTHNEEDDMSITIPSYSWDDIKDICNDSCQTILDKAKSEGIKNAHVRLNLVDASNHKNVLLTSYDGKTDFDITELTEKERTVRKNMKRFSFKYFSHSE